MTNQSVVCWSEAPIYHDNTIDIFCAIVSDDNSEKNIKGKLSSFVVNDICGFKTNPEFKLLSTKIQSEKASRIVQKAGERKLFKFFKKKDFLIGRIEINKDVNTILELQCTVLVEDKSMECTLQVIFSRSRPSERKGVLLIYPDVTQMAYNKFAGSSFYVPRPREKPGIRSVPKIKPFSDQFYKRNPYHTPSLLKGLMNELISLNYNFHIIGN